MVGGMNKYGSKGPNGATKMWEQMEGKQGKVLKGLEVRKAQAGKEEREARAMGREKGK